jgi:hypothetical protein
MNPLPSLVKALFFDVDGTLAEAEVNGRDWSRCGRYRRAGRLAGLSANWAVNSWRGD